MSVLLLDTNLLLLYLAGITDRRAVTKIRRLSAYTTDDFAETGATLLTADLDLYLAAMRAKLAATNFAHIRD